VVNVIKDENEVIEASKNEKKTFDFNTAYKKVDKELKLTGGIYRINYSIKVDKVVTRVVSKRNLEELED
jgi:hypothetical protein